MKSTNIAIAFLVAALLGSMYLLANEVYKRINNDGVSLVSRLVGQKDKCLVTPSVDAAPSKADLDIKEALLNKNRPVLPPPPTAAKETVTTEQPRGKPQNAPEKKELRPVRDIRVVMYVTSWCPYCKKARDYINSQGASLVEYDIERDKSAADDMVKKTGGSRGVPVVDIEGIIIRGYSPQAIQNAIKQKQNL